MTGSDIGAYLSHMAEQFHTASGGSIGTEAPTKEQMKEAIKARAAEKKDKIPPPPQPKKKVAAPRAKGVPTPAPAPAAGAGAGAGAGAANGTSAETTSAAPQAKKTDGSPAPPNLKEIAKQNQLLDAQKAMLEDLNKSLASGIPYEDPPVAKKSKKRGVGTGKAEGSATAPDAASATFSWEAKEMKTMKLRENPSSWDWASVEGQGGR
jgi:hypothetical protein